MKKMLVILLLLSGCGTATLHDNIRYSYDQKQGVLKIKDFETKINKTGRTTFSLDMISDKYQEEHFYYFEFKDGKLIKFKPYHKVVYK